MLNFSRIAMTCNYSFSTLLLRYDSFVMWIKRFQTL